MKRITFVLLLGVMLESMIYAEPRFQHIVVIIQENRTPDDLLVDCQIPGANIQANPNGPEIPLANTPDLAHTHGAFINERNGIWPKTKPAWWFGHVQLADIQPYCQLATQYGYADMMFQTNEGPSLPAHMMLTAATAQISNTSTTQVSNNSGGTEQIPCPAGSKSEDYVDTINPDGDTGTTYPCFSTSSLFDLFYTNNVAWNYYGVNWTVSTEEPWMPTWYYQDWYTANNARPTYKQNVTASNRYLLNDIANGHLAQVVYVTPTSACSDHPSQNKGCGPSWVSSVVNAIGNSPFWSTTAIIVVWDDWGGFWDHVPPMVNTWGEAGDSYIGGFRVPMIVVSPYTPTGLVSETQHDFASIVRFIECQMVACELIGPGTFGDYIDQSDTLSEFFTLQSPVSFVPIMNGVREITKEELEDSRPVDND